MAGARRTRRAFQFCVIACLLFTGALYLTERSYRYDRAETLYRDGLTMHPESGRVLLRAAVRTVEELGKVPPSKYLQALAEREEADLILPTFKRAYENDRSNPELAIRYGARLFEEGKFIEARERFHDAVINAPNNALPVYLEAAAMAWSAKSDDDINQALAMVARANASGTKVSLPRVLWFPGLPKDSRAYADLTRKVADECCAPLYRLTERVIDAAPKIAEEQGYDQADLCLQTLQNMGERLLQSPDQSGPLAVAALTVQLHAIQEREHIAEGEGLRTNEDIIKHRVEIESALNRIQQFEDHRDERIEQHEDRVTFPLFRAIEALFYLVVAYTVVLLISLSQAETRLASFFRFAMLVAVTFFTAFLAPFVLTFMSGPQRVYWTVPLKRLAMVVLVGGVAIFLIVLLTLTGVEKLPPGPNAWMPAVHYAWLGLLALLILFAVFHPAVNLPDARSVAEAHPSDEPESARLSEAQRQRVQAWIVMSRRYLGILCGLTIVAVCTWAITFRMATGAFPLQYVLVTTGLRDQELAAIQQAIAMLH